jgi:uncharacterized iron-regulated membrane protein
MTLFKLCWETHKWIGIALSLILINISVTGLLLLEKKQYDWIQPGTRRGQPGSPDDFIGMQRVLDAVLACGHPDFTDVNAIDRVDFRPGKRVYKVRSQTHHAEIQVDAITGEILSTSTRFCDFLEQLHDGSILGAWMHDMIMPIVAVANTVLALSGLYLWLGPKFKRKRRRQETPA